MLDDSYKIIDQGISEYFVNKLSINGIRDKNYDKKEKMRLVVLEPADGNATVLFSFVEESKYEKLKKVFTDSKTSEVIVEDKMCKRHLPRANKFVVSGNVYIIPEGYAMVPPTLDMEENKDKVNNSLNSNASETVHQIVQNMEDKYIVPAETKPNRRLNNK